MHACMEAGRQTDRQKQTYILTYRQTDRDRQTGRQTDRKVDRQTDTGRHRQEWVWDEV